MGKCAHCQINESYREIFADKIPICYFCYKKHVETTKIYGTPLNEWIKFLRTCQKNIKKWSDEKI